MPKRPGSEVGWSKIPLARESLISLLSFTVMVNGSSLAVPSGQFGLAEAPGGMGVEAVSVSLASDVFEAQQCGLGPSPRPAIGPSPLDDPDQAAITITRGQGFGPAIARPGLGI